jgi:hypothetical protein
MLKRRFGGGCTCHEGARMGGDKRDRERGGKDGRERERGQRERARDDGRDDGLVPAIDMLHRDNQRGRSERGGRE